MTVKKLLAVKPHRLEELKLNQLNSQMKKVLSVRLAVESTHEESKKHQKGDQGGNKSA